MSASPAARRSVSKRCRWRCFSRRFAILDETDSGLDIDALKIVADNVNASRAPDRGLLVITHYQRLARLHQAGPRARAGQGPDRRQWRSGTGARTRARRLRQICEGGVSIAAELPNRRNEAWKYSDLRAGGRRRAATCCATGATSSSVWRRGRSARRLRPGKKHLFVERMVDDRYMDARSFDWTRRRRRELTRVVIQTGKAAATVGGARAVGGRREVHAVRAAVRARLARIETHVTIEGEGAEVTNERRLPVRRRAVTLI